MNKVIKTTRALAAVTALALATPVHAQSALEERLAQLEQQVAILKRQIEVDKEEVAKKAPDTPIVTASSKDGFSIKSPDDSFKLKIRGLVQADARIFTNNKKDLTGTGDNFIARRVRPIFEGTVAKNFDFYIMPDFGSNPSNANAILVDAYLEAKLNPAFKVKGGKFKAPFGLERLQSDAVANFIEAGLPTNLVPNRDVGFQLSGDLLNESLNYAVGVFNGGPDLSSVDASDNNNDKDIIGRVFTQPFKNSSLELAKGLGLGVAGSYGHKEGSTLPTYRSPGQANVFSYASGVAADGAHTRLSPQAYYYNGGFGIIGEYVTSQQALNRVSGGINRETFTNKAWQVSSNYVLTGELASYKGITPRKPFDLSKGQWGAFEVVARYGKLKVDDAIFDNSYASLNSSISEEEAWAAGINWYLNKNVKFAVDFEQTQFVRGAANGENRPDENIIFSRLQLAF